MYQPEGWDEIKLGLIANLFGEPDASRYRDGFEAGADAMHKADIKWILDHILITEGVLSKKDWEEFMF